MSSMFYEVLDAIESYYSNDEELQSDCVLWLSKISNNTNDMSKCDDWFEKHHSCEKCGAKKEIYHYQQPQPYQEGVVYEEMYEELCPYCDWQMGLEEVID